MDILKNFNRKDESSQFINIRFINFEYLEIPDLDSEIKHYENKLKSIDEEYSKTHQNDWPRLKEKKLYFIKELNRLNKIKKNKKSITIDNPVIQNESLYNKEEIVIKDAKEKQISEEDQWNINKKLLLESYKEEDKSEEITESLEQNYKFINNKNTLEEQNEIEEVEKHINFNKIKEDKTIENIEYKEQTILRDNKGGKIIQLDDTIRNFGNKFITKIPFKDILGIRIPVTIKLKPNISFKLLALIDTGCTQNIIHDKYFLNCPEIVHTIDDKNSRSIYRYVRDKKDL